MGGDITAKKCGKGAASHREVTFEDPTLAAEVVLFADLLIRLLDARAATPRLEPLDGRHHACIVRQTLRRVGGDQSAAVRE